MKESVSKRNTLKSVVWKRQDSKDSEGKTVYRYTIVGMLVTDTPIPSLDCNEIVIDGEVFGIEDVLDLASKRKPKIRVGDATNVLLQLKEL